MTTNKSTIPAEEQISHNSGLCLNWVHKRCREACWDTGTVRLCLREPCSFEFVLCLSPCEANRTAKLTSKQVSNSVGLCGSRVFVLLQLPTTSNNKNSKARERRQTTPVTLTHLVKHLKHRLGGNTLSNPVNYSPHLYFFTSSLLADRQSARRKHTVCTEIQRRSL